MSVNTCIPSCSCKILVISEKQQHFQISKSESHQRTKAKLWVAIQVEMYIVMQPEYFLPMFKKSLGGY